MGEREYSSPELEEYGSVNRLTRGEEEGEGDALNQRS